VRLYSLLEQLVLGATPDQRALADALRLDPSQIVALLDTLEQRGLARRGPHPVDRRRKRVTVTSTGRETYRRARPLVEASLDDVLDGLDAAERRTLHDLLHRVARPGADAAALEQTG
jgi:DNA-binding MarR family transcriptional regulator